MLTDVKELRTVPGILKPYVTLANISYYINTTLMKFLIKKKAYTAVLIWADLFRLI